MSDDTMIEKLKDAIGEDDNFNFIGSENEELKPLVSEKECDASPVLIGPNTFIPAFIKRGLEHPELSQDPDFLNLVSETIKEQMGVDGDFYPDDFTPESLEELQKQAEFVEEFNKFQENMKDASNMVKQLSNQLERISDIQNRIIESGHEIDVTECIDENKSIGEVMEDLQKSLETMKSENPEDAENVIIDDGKPDLKQQVYTFIEGKQLSLYGIIYRITKVYPLAIELKKESRETHIQKLKAGDQIRIYGLPYKILSTLPGGKIKIENKKFDF